MPRIAANRTNLRLDRPLRVKFTKTLSAIALVGVALCAANSAAAQTRHGTLREVNNMEIAVEPPDADAKACGVTESGLTEAVRKGADGAGFVLESYDYALYLRVSSLPSKTDCFSSVDIEVRYSGKLPLPAYPKGNFVRTVLWSNGTIVFSARNHHGAEIAAVVTILVKGLITDWTEDNSLQRAG